MGAIGIIDYGMGNLRSVQKAFEYIGARAELTSRPDGLSKYDGIVLPGVGAFGKAMENLESLGLIEPIRELAASGTPILGICLGLQLFFDYSEEAFAGAAAGAATGPAAGTAANLPKGLGLMRGVVRRFPDGLKVPQMGWNRIRLTGRGSSSVLDSGLDGSYVYFVHSYYVDPEDPGEIAAVTDYGITFASAVSSRNLTGVQFHPEKSGKTGLNLLSNFARYAGALAGGGNEFENGGSPA